MDMVISTLLIIMTAAQMKNVYLCGEVYTEVLSTFLLVAVCLGAKIGIKNLNLKKNNIKFYMYTHIRACIHIYHHNRCDKFMNQRLDVAVAKTPTNLYR